jgi:predicted enzyme related to lactoylglutathione lyase
LGPRDVFRLAVKEIKLAQLDYVGGLVIQAKDPRRLAQWYSEKFGLLMGVEYDGGIYGGFRNDTVSFHFGIVPAKDRSRSGEGGVAITFHVDDFEGYVAELTERGLKPVGEAHDEEGHFAIYRDPEGHELTIWGD